MDPVTIATAIATTRTLVKSAKHVKDIAKGLDDLFTAQEAEQKPETKGKPKRISKNVHQVIMDKIREHSRKPDCVRDRIVELCGDLPRIELFAREKTEGWDVWGDEV